MNAQQLIKILSGRPLDSKVKIFNIGCEFDIQTAYLDKNKDVILTDHVMPVVHDWTEINSFGEEPPKEIIPEIPLVAEEKSDDRFSQNYTYVGNRFYIVRTQAGFNQAIKHYLGEKNEYTVQGYPTSYPSLITFNMGYRGYFYLEVNSIHLNKLFTHCDLNYVI